MPHTTPPGPVRTLLIDNHDSFTFNLFQLLAAINGVPPRVVPNDQLDWESLQRDPFDNIVLSPGPGRPEKDADFGVCRQAILLASVPLLGVCLGHQGIGHAYGARVQHAPSPMHGRLSPIFHDGSPLFAGIPQGFQAVRYHSLVVAPELPPELEKIAWTPDGILMGLAHRTLPRWGIQFHPESICSEHGALLLRNFRDLTLRARPRSAPLLASSPVAAAPPPPASPALALRHRRLPLAHDAQRLFCALFRDEPLAFWLDSSRAEPGLARFSFLGSGAAHISYDQRAGVLSVRRGDLVETHRETIFAYLSRELAAGRTSSELPFDLQGGFVGYLGYGLGDERRVEARRGDVCPGQAPNQAPPLRGSPRPVDPPPGSPHPAEPPEGGLISPRSGTHVPAPGFNPVTSGAATTPDAMFMRADRLLVVDHQENELYLVRVGGDEDGARAWFDEVERRLRTLPDEAPAAPSGAEVTLRLERSRERYLDDIARCQRYILDGESYELCLTNQLISGALPDPLPVYLALRRINPAPYAAFLRFPGLTVLSSSPERFLRIDAAGGVESKPIKGTRPRGETPEQDDALRRDLGASEKDRSENLMIVDLLRNDLGRVCEVGSVHVPALMQVESYASVHQLVSTVRGRLRPDASVIDCVQAAFPGGSMTGAPKLRTLRILDTLETRPRGVYSGAIGYFSWSGAADLSIVIRTLVATPEETTLGVGGAIVALSDPEAEFEETLVKARALIDALVCASRGRPDPALRDRMLGALRERGSASTAG